MSSDSTQLLLARQYLDALEQFAEGDALAAFFSPEVVQQEFPNRLLPSGATRNLTELLQGARRGRQVLRQQTYRIDRAVEQGERLALEVLWTAELAIPVGSLKAGDTMRARFAVFLEFEQGKIVRQHNYDCFDPF